VRALAVAQLIGHLPRRAAPRCQRSGVRGALGEEGWARLPRAVQARFADGAAAAEYVGRFELVRASFTGRLLALLCRLIGTPVAPYTGVDVPATVRVFADGRGGVVWERCYRFSAGRHCIVRSTKRCDARGALIEELPCGLSMPLAVFERGGVLHFLSSSYYFRCLGLKLTVPAALPPGRTHVEHIDEGGGWFRFTMSVSHPWLGEVYFQTGRFRAASEAP
jgi:hypothetical protein